MLAYKEYGYTNAEASHTNIYLFQPLIKLLLKDGNKAILDVGCGNGAIAIKLIEQGFNVYGIDASIQGIQLAKKRFHERFFVQELTQDGWPKELSNIASDTIISTEVIEHLYDPRSYVSFCENILLANGGGQLIISAPYHGYWKNLALAVIGNLDAHHTVLWDGEHIKFWSKATLITLLKEQEFKVSDFVSFGRVPFYGSQC